MLRGRCGPNMVKITLSRPQVSYSVQVHLVLEKVASEEDDEEEDSQEYDGRQSNYGESSWKWEEKSADSKDIKEVAQTMNLSQRSAELCTLLKKRDV
ncbi:hypothetical protein DMENIID0001_042820 [Sergentomyia squamirostris]